MPVLDMPLEKLREYRGVNPRPQDFDTYWDESLQEMHGIAPDPEYREAEFQAPGVHCQDLFFTGVGGARVHARLVCPPEDGKKHPALLMFHGYTGAAPDFFSMLPYAYAGFYVAALEVRGQGGVSECPNSLAGPTVYGQLINGVNDADPKALFFRSVYLDTAELAGVLMSMPQVDEARVGATGGSQGGGLTLACAALEPRIALAAPTMPFLSDYRRVWDMDLDKDAYREIREYFRHFDPRHERREEFFTRLGYIDVQHLAPRIKARVVMATGLLDGTCPPSTQFAAYNKIASEKEMMLYPDYGHEGMLGQDEIIFQRMMALR